MSRSLNILHLNHALDWRGGEQQTYYLLQGLRERGHRSVLAAPRDGLLAGRARELGVEVLPLEARGDLSWSARGRLGSHLDGVDIIHAHTAKAHGWLRSALAGRGRRPRTVVTRRVDFPLKGGLASRWKYRGIDRYIAVSACIARVLEAGGVSPDLLRVVHSGIDPSRFQGPPDREGILAELGISERDTPLVGFVGALVGHKAPDVLTEAAAALSPRVHVIFAGEGPLRAKLESRSRALGLERRVHFLGYRRDVPRWLGALQVFVLPSRKEGLGTSVLDAMAAGVPVVAGRAGGIPEMVEPEISGLLVQPDSVSALSGAVDRILRDRELSAALRRGGLERVGKFTAPAMVEGTVGVYRELLRAKG